MGTETAKPFHDTHAAGISRMLLQMGFQKYMYTEKAGFVVNQLGSAEQVPRLSLVRIRSANSNLVTDAKACQGVFNKMWDALRKEGLFVKFSWDTNGHEDRTGIVVAKKAFTAPYDEKKQALLPVDATVGELRGTVFGVLAKGNIAAAQGGDGFVVHDDPSGKVVYVTWQPSVAQSLDTPVEALDLGRERLVGYHRALRELIPCALLAQSDDPYGTLMVGTTWVDVYTAYIELIKESWNLTLDAKEDHPVTGIVEEAKEAQRAPFIHSGSLVTIGVSAEAVETATVLLARAVHRDQERADRLVAAVDAAEALEVIEEIETDENEVPYPTEWEMMADLFVNVEQAAEAVREIAQEHSQARDSAASSMERRLHHMVLMAVAAGSPEAQELARQALATQTLFFDRK